MSMNRTLLTVVLLGLGVGCSDDGGNNDPTTFTVALSKAAEVPLCAAAGTAATGAATVTVSADNTSIAVTSLTHSGLSGAPTLAHIHAGAPGVMGPVVLDFGAPLTSPISKAFTAADYPATPPSGAPANFSAFAIALRAGNAYINVHTAACAPGEVRGQIGD